MIVSLLKLNTMKTQENTQENHGRETVKTFVSLQSNSIMWSRPEKHGRVATIQVECILDQNNNKDMREVRQEEIE